MLSGNPSSSPYAPLFRRISRGLVLGFIFDLAAILFYIAFVFYAHVTYEEQSGSPMGTDPQASAGYAMRGSTMLLWMFLGAYMAGYIYYSLPPDDPRNMPKYSFKQLTLILFGSTFAIFGIGWLILSMLGLYWQEIGCSILVFLMGLVLGTFIYFALSERIPVLFPSYIPKPPTPTPTDKIN